MTAGIINPTIAFPELKFGKHQTPYLKQIGCPIDHMPYLMQPLDPQKGIWFPWTHWNPFQPRGKWTPKGTEGTKDAAWRPPALFDGLVGMPSWKVLVRVFGWVEKMKRLALGNFAPQIHIIEHSRVEALLKAGKLTAAMASDPETARSHFIGWRGVDREGINYLFDESPRIDEGEWVNASGERGEGQHIYAGVGSNFYKRHIRDREKEHGTEPVLRLGDPRGFASEESTASGTRNLFELFNSDGADNEPAEAAMYFQPAKVRRIATLDLENIITLFAFDMDRMQREGSLSVENTPHLFISDRCQNTIKCILNYQIPESGRASDDDKNPYKDPIDMLRYLFSVPLEFIDPERPTVRGGGGWG